MRELGQRHILRKRRRRATVVGTSLYARALPMSFVAGTLDLFQGMWPFVVTNYLAVLGFWLSLSMYRQKKWGSDYVWPGFAGIFLCSLVTIHRTGDLHSPFLGIYLAILTAMGLILQTRFTRKAVLTAAAMYFLFWIAVHLLFPTPAAVWQSFSSFFIATKQILLVGALGTGLIFFLRAQDEQSSTFVDQLRALNEARQNLAHASKMAEIGDLVATTAHELTQPVQVIFSTSELLKLRLENAAPGFEATEKTKKIAQKLHESAERLIPLLLQFRNFSRKESFQPATMDLREVVQSLESITQYDLRFHRVRCEIELPEEPTWVHGDSLRLQQILLNLVNNARDACKTAHAPSISIRLEKSPARARLFIRNNGPEIPCDVQKRLFEPYYTTKPKNQGTGLGLKICEQLVHQHRGKIYFSSGPESTVFLVDLPASSQSGSFQSA